MKRTTAVLLAVCVALPAAAARRRAVTPGSPACAETALVSAVYPNDLALDDSYLYYTDDQGGVFRVARSGGQPQRLAQLTNGSIAITIAIDDQSVFFTAAPPDSYLASINSVPKTGGTTAVLATGVLSPLFLVPDGNWIYWNSVGTPAGISYDADGKIERMQKDGTSRQTLASSLSLPLAIAIDGDNVVFGETGVTIRGSHPGLRTVPKNGGPVITLLDQRPVTSVAITATTIYAGYYGGTLAAIAKGTRSETTLLSSSTALMPVCLVVDGQELDAFMLGDTDQIVAVPLTGGTARNIRSATFTTQRFLISGCAVFYSIGDNATNGSIHRGPK